jgi:tRNA 2-thiocytidine biosynthesis protein TtcA
MLRSLEGPLNDTQTMLNDIEKLLARGASSPTEADSTHPVTADELSKDPETPSIHKLEKRIFGSVGRAIGDFGLIDDGDKILVAVSGGKDSWVLLYVLRELQKRAPVDFEILAVNIDQGWKGFRQDVVEDFLRIHEIPFHMEDFNIAGIIEEKTAPGSTPCSLCSRLRRGSLYGLAERFGCNKIALGHHLDDLVETLFLNMLFLGKISTMAPKLKADDGKNMVIRPLAYTHERDIIEYTKQMKFPIVCCQCPLMCGETVHGDYKRRMVKQLLSTLETRFPNVKDSMISSLGNVNPTHLLDPRLFDFKGMLSNPSHPGLSKEDFEREINS